MKVRLILLVLATSSLILISFMVPLALLLKSFAADKATYLAQIQTQAAATVAVSLSPDSLKTAIESLNIQNPDEQVTVFLPHNKQVGFQASQTTPAVQLAQNGATFTEVIPGGEVVLRPVSGLKTGPVVVQTYVSDAVLTKGVGQAWTLLAMVAIGLLVLAVVVASQLTRSLVRPLAKVADVADQLAQGDLSARAAVDGPTEIRQVSNGLNRLAARIGDLLAHERETLADLSHRLRTPLTALRIDAESLAADEETRYRVISDVDALTQTVNEIIAEARRPTGDTAGAISNATVVVRDRAAFWQPLAEDQERWMTVDIPAAGLLVKVPPEDLAACVDILLENVFAHTPEGTPFSIRLSAKAGGGAWLVVSDSGPGFTNPDVAKRGESTRGSTGLGLDIASRVAETSGGTLTLGRSPQGGGAVTVGLGAVDTPAYPRRPGHQRRRTKQPPLPPRVLRSRREILARRAGRARQPVRAMQPLRSIQPGRALQPLRALQQPLRSLLPGREVEDARIGAEVAQWRSIAGRGRDGRYSDRPDRRPGRDGWTGPRLPPGYEGWDGQDGPDGRDRFDHEGGYQPGPGNNGYPADRDDRYSGGQDEYYQSDYDGFQGDPYQDRHPQDDPDPYRSGETGRYPVDRDDRYP